MSIFAHQYVMNAKMWGTCMGGFAEKGEMRYTQGIAFN